MFIICSEMSRNVKFMYKDYEISISTPRDRTFMNDCRIYKDDIDITGQFSDLNLFNIELEHLILIKNRIDSLI